LKNIKYIRLNASKKSGGTSDFIIKNKIIYHLKKFKTKGKSLLDFGAGKGELINILKKFDFLEVSGVDLFKKPKSLNKDIKWYQFDLNNKFKIKNKFDFVICSETIEHLENPRHILRTIYNIQSTNNLNI
jgi:2-polyprenyl-3-methyl-5-hydroxy-6-metoxy-1,4-benzoquinol methylase